MARDFNKAMDKWMKQYQKASNTVEDIQGKVDAEEQDLAGKEDQTEKAERAEQEEITEAEEEGNPAEIEDAEKKMEKILEYLKKEEREVDDIEKKLEDELGTEEDQINIEERIERTAEKDFKQAAQELEDVISELGDYQDTKGKIDKKELFQETEDALQNIRYSAELFRRVLKLENELIKELRETKNEELNLENLAERMEDQLQADKKEIKQLIRDTEKLQIKKDVAEAKSEVKDLSQLIQHTQDEEAEIRNIKQEIQKEIEELGKIIGEDENILKEMKACRQLLEELEKIMEGEKGLLSFGGSSRQAKKVLEDVEKTDQKLKTMLNEDRNFIDELEKVYDKLASKSNSAGKSILKSKINWIIIAAILLVIIVIGFIQGNT